VMRLPMPETKLTEEQERYVTRSLTTSAERLLKFIQMKAPAVVVCKELVHTCERAMLLYGHYYWEAWGDRMNAWVRNMFGLCESCQGNHPRAELMCPQCTKDGDEYVAAMEKEDDMGGPACE
jgi:hypothetical protein